MMLARDYASCHAAISTLVMIVANNVHKLRWPAKSLILNHIDLLKRKLCAQRLQLNLRELTRVIHQPQHRRILSTRYIVVDVIQSIETQLNTS